MDCDQTRIFAHRRGDRSGANDVVNPAPRAIRPAPCTACPCWRSTPRPRSVVSCQAQPCLVRAMPADRNDAVLKLPQTQWCSRCKQVLHGPESRTCATRRGQGARWPPARGVAGLQAGVRPAAADSAAQRMRRLHFWFLGPVGTSHIVTRSGLPPTVGRAPRRPPPPSSSTYHQSGSATPRSPC